ncbi:hypothetical protein OOJ91_08255 [Micromonospora lupini]|uniref:hypothetical protein n=1 Tax=Micromonospora lupini TaxID=285679 RepID=UPI002254F5FD|nr:hypothetical protein [Micromonospora lupini]MCX5065872.1 hypothetical protein [Micromonospora lupini]
MSIGLLLACALVSRSPGSRWALGTALAVLLVDAVRTTPAPRDGAEYGGMTFGPGPDPEVPSALEMGFSLCWASLTVVLVLLVAWRRGGWQRRTVAPGVVGAALIIGYAAFRVVSIRRAVVADPPRGAGTDVAELMMAVSMAVLPPLALGITALALASALAGHSRRLASIGAVLLALMALPLMDTCITMVPMPLYVGSVNALFGGDAIRPTLSMPQPVPALTAVVELAGYLLLVAGLTTSSRREGALPARA